MISGITIISSIIISLYVFMVTAFALAWIFRENYKIQNKESINKKISIIIAFRNEEDNLQKLLDSLLKQNYPDFEIILIDDHSYDNSASIIAKVQNPTISYYLLPSELNGKKSALRYGAIFAKGDILFFTDADCYVENELWLSTMLDYMIRKDVKMLCGIVCFDNKKGVFSKLLQLEFLSMVGSGAAGFFLNIPFMCNGANYAITRDVFNEASKYFNDKYSSGDDVFLLHYVSKKYKVDFIKNKNTTIESLAPKNIKDFFAQRIRWASKTSGYKNIMMFFIMFINVTTSLLLVVSLIFGIFSIEYLYLFLILFLIKIFFDNLFMLPILRFFQKRKLIYYLPLLQIFYSFYIVTTFVLLLFWQPEWKGRKIIAVSNAVKTPRLQNDQCYLLSKKA